MSDLKDQKKPSGPIRVRNLTVTVDRDLCIGAATCSAIAPKGFELDSDAKAVILKSIDEETDEVIIEAAKSCPVLAIIIEDEKGKRIFPK